jgi:hypothetical protein
MASPVSQRPRVGSRRGVPDPFDVAALRTLVREAEGDDMTRDVKIAEVCRQIDAWSGSGDGPPDSVRAIRQELGRGTEDAEEAHAQLGLLERTLAELGA